MDDRAQPPKPVSVDRNESAHQNDAQAFSQVVGTMKQEIQDEAKRLTSPAPMGKPQAMTQACSVMKEEIYGRSPATEQPPAEENAELSPAERERKKL